MIFNMEKILQIIPADGWRAVYHKDDGTPVSENVACWAVVMDQDCDCFVVGMYSGDPGLLRMDKDLENFSHYYHSTD
jgi:hypothetical protein